MNKLALLISLSLSVFALSGKAVNASTVDQDISVVSCTVDFKVKNSFQSERTQAKGHVSFKNGVAALKSLGDVQINVYKRIISGEVEFTLKITEGSEARGEVKAGNHAFQYTVPVSVLIEDGEDGYKLDQVTVACDPASRAG